MLRVRERGAPFFKFLRYVGPKSKKILLCTPTRPISMKNYPRRARYGRGFKRLPSINQRPAAGCLSVRPAAQVFKRRSEEHAVMLRTNYCEAGHGRRWIRLEVEAVPSFHGRGGRDRDFGRALVEVAAELTGR